MEKANTKDVNITDSIRKYSTSSEGAVEPVSGTRRLQDLQCQLNLIPHGRSLDSVKYDNVMRTDDTTDSQCSEPVDGIIAKKRKRRLVRNHVVGVVKDLSNVLYDINSVTSELRGVLNQIERVTSHIEHSAMTSKAASEKDISLLNSPILVETSRPTFPPRSSSWYGIPSSYSVDERPKKTTLLTKSDLLQKIKVSEDQIRSKSAISETSSVVECHQTCRRSFSADWCNRVETELQNGKCISDRSQTMKYQEGTHQRWLNRSTDFNCSYKSALNNKSGVGLQPFKNVTRVPHAETHLESTDKGKKIYVQERLKKYSNSNILEKICQQSKYCQQDQLKSKQETSARNSMSSRYRHASCSRSKSMPTSLSKCILKKKNDDVEGADFCADYDREINTWTTFAMVHIDREDQKF
ncbi:uncharacterized protein [Antedon mediterranea]|uniref:uncharacterized protein n=1 Tax=Antedon mediterranea TaxID=105859 RepID=UPI003AF7DEEB